MHNPIKGLIAVRDSFYQDVADAVSDSVTIGNVLDVGTGRGLLVLKIAEKNSRLKAYGVDVSQKAVMAARANARKSGLANVPNFDVGDVCSLPYEDEFFALVVSTFSLHHWKDKAAGLNEIFRVLRPGGETWIYDHWKDPTPEARQELRRDFGRLAAWFALSHLRFVSSILTEKNATRVLEDPSLKFQEKRLEPCGIFLLLRLKKTGAGILVK
ncbi:MAG: class I SAM-dependent methyltransferase [Methanothrix sp.]|jgi:ubiquinone/menaquinone biosynthesis C-methylase UbiE|nr:class I SAM-dependent methyltransferase [Methanothrix sp.]